MEYYTVVESFTGRIFSSNAETILNAVAQINDDLTEDNVATLSELHSMLDVDQVGVSSFEWWLDETPYGIEVDFTAKLLPDHTPALEFRIHPDPRPKRKREVQWVRECSE